MRRLLLNLTIVIAVASFAACDTGGGRTTDPTTTTCDGGDCATLCDGGTCPVLCDGGSCTPTTRPFGEPCSRNGDCTSGVCLPISEGHNICTAACTETSGCLEGWSCDTIVGVESRVCQCTPSDEVCDGADNDCDGEIDNQPVSDLRCAVQHSAAWVCLQGACQKTGCEQASDCGDEEACNLATHQCGPTPGRIKVCYVDPSSQQVDPSTCYPGLSQPPALNFGGVEVGASAQRTVRVFNEGGSDLSVSTPLSPSGSAFASAASSSTIGPGQSRDIGVSFNPTVNGAAQGTLNISSSDELHSSITVPLVGTGLGADLCFTPATLDFGSVAVGGSRTLSVTVTNCGGTVLDVVELRLDPVLTPSLFAISAPPIPFRMNVGSSITLTVRYTPAAVGMTPDIATLFLKASGQLLRSVQLRGFGVDMNCAPNGVDVTPTAVITASQHFRTVPTTLTLDTQSEIGLSASASISAGTINQYSWQLVSQPQGSSLSLPTGTARSSFIPVVPGAYVVSLTVGVGGSCLSAPTQVTLTVGGAPRVQVRVTWPQAYGDVDLHYVGPDGAFNQTMPYVTDLDWHYSLATAYGTGTPSPTSNSTPDWGLDNTCAADGLAENNALFEVDQRSGYGPETVAHRQPFDGVYKVLVHYYCNGSGTTVSPVVTIFVDGQVAWEGSQPGMTTRKVWEAAQIEVSDDGASIVVTPLTTALYTVAQGC